MERSKFTFTIDDDHKNRKLLNQKFLPKNCLDWNERVCQKSGVFVKYFDEEFYPKVYEEYKMIRGKGEELNEVFSSTKAGSSLKLRSIEKNIKNHLHDLSTFFKSQSFQTVNSNANNSSDPWINEMTIRHYSAIFLEEKAAYLEDLQRMFYESRRMERECFDKMNEFVNEFLVNVKTSDPIDDCKTINDYNNYDCNFNEEISFKGSESSDSWTEILEEYNLNYEWRLECAPLDGFISTLFNYLKSLYDFTALCGYTIHHSTSSNQHHFQNHGQNTPLFNIPHLIPEDIRVGFLQKRSASSLLSRTWQTIFVIFQKSTKFLHVYKSFLKGTSDSSNSGKLMIPTPGTLYPKTALTDMSSLIIQYLRECPHQPASIASELLSPNSSIKISDKTSASATDPASFTFQIRTETDKFTFRAFCEEDFVDWIIVFNDSIKSMNPNPTPTTTPMLSKNQQQLQQQTHDHINDNINTNTLLTFQEHFLNLNVTDHHKEDNEQEILFEEEEEENGSYSSYLQSNDSSQNSILNTYYSTPTAPNIENPWS